MFKYTGPNAALRGLFNAVVLVMETGFAVTGFVAILLNLLLAEEVEETEDVEAEELEGEPRAGHKVSQNSGREQKVVSEKSDMV